MELQKNICDNEESEDHRSGFIIWNLSEMWIFQISPTAWTQHYVLHYHLSSFLWSNSAMVHHPLIQEQLFSMTGIYSAYQHDLFPMKNIFTQNPYDCVRPFFGTCPQKCLNRPSYYTHIILLLTLILRMICIENRFKSVC